MTNIMATSEKWLQAGIELFAKEGLQAMQAERICSRMGWSPSEFFYYFEDEDIFLRQVIRHWKESKTSRVVETFGRAPAAMRVEKLVDLVFADRSLHDFLFHLRKLGATDEEVGQLVTDIEEERIDATRPIFNGLGLGQREIDMKVEILYSFYLGWYERHKDREFTPALRAAVQKQITYLLGLD